MSKFLWFSWKDKTHPLAGGAEVISTELQKGLIAQGHEVTLITSMYSGARKEEIINGITVIRLSAPRVLLPFISVLYYLTKLRGKADYLIEEVNTAPYLLNYFKKKERVALLFHQLAEEVWDYEFSFPFNLLGRYVLEPTALYLNKISKRTVVMSESTKKGLLKYGYTESTVAIISEATDLQKLQPNETIKKAQDFTVTYFGSMRHMKRPEEVIKAFASSLRGTSAKLLLAGGANEKRAKELLELVDTLGLSEQTTWMGRISDQEKRELFKKSHVVCMTSIKEGWGIVIMEAAFFEAAGVVYDVDGLREAVIDKKTGIIVKSNTFEKLGEALKFLYEHPDICKKLGENAREFNEKFSFERTCAEFIASIEK
ncbi:MAG: glycosyltransferase family 4 protein [Candidatus Dojkabacteria bacterium]|nr:MAG: glycosyltransferase family 4 protein [Candidatus Dojkabacteria bacterium]